MKRLISFSLMAGLFYMMLLTSCGNDGIDNEETSREAIKNKKQQEDSFQEADSRKKKSILDLPVWIYYIIKKE